MTTKRKILPSVFEEPMSQAQLNSLRTTFRNPETLAEVMLDSKIVKTMDEGLRRARMIFCVSGEPAPKGTGPLKPQPAPTAVGDEEGAEPAAKQAQTHQLMVNRRDITPAQMTEQILGWAKEMELGPERGWQAGKALLELATFNKQWGVQAFVALTRIIEGKNLLAQKTLLALGMNPYNVEVDQLALRKLLSGPKARAALERWGRNPNHPLRPMADMYLLFMGPKDDGKDA